MGFWKQLGTAAKVGLNIAIDLQDAHVINVKHLDKVKTVKEVIAHEVEKAKPTT